MKHKEIPMKMIHHFLLIFITLIPCVTHTMYKLNEKDYPYYHQNKKFYHTKREEFFTLIEKLDVKNIKKLIKEYPGIAHTKCEFGDENITIDYYPLSYLLSLKKIDYDQVKEIAHIIIDSTTDIETLYHSFLHILDHIIIDFYPINENSLAICEKIIARKNNIFLSNPGKENKEYTIKFLYAAHYFFEKIALNNNENNDLIKILQDRMCF